MMTKAEFDNCIRSTFCTYYDIDIFGYQIHDINKTHSNYLNNSSFDRFVSEMQNNYPDAYKKYIAGKGSELISQHRNNIYLPPKMASVASSSRFCYLALRNGAQALGGGCTIDFEHECKIKGIKGTAPQIDAYSPDGNIFIEVKCHEIFDKHTVSLSSQYSEWLFRKDTGFLSPETAEAADQCSIPLSAFGINKEHTMFDIKQFLCHLMGIASQSAEKAELVYLFFKPQTFDSRTQDQIDEVFKNLTQEIRTIFTSTPITRFCNTNHITLRAVAQQNYEMTTLTPKNMITLY
jgi:hypothetical protein